jgi:hypothetical protein
MGMVKCTGQMEVIIRVNGKEVILNKFDKFINKKIFDLEN